MISPTQTLQTVSLLDLLGAGLIVPQLANHARQLGCNHLLVGAMGSLYSAFQFLSGPMTLSKYQLISLTQEYNHLLVGAMGSLYSAFQFLSGPMTGSLGDVKGRKTILFLSICLSGFAYVMLGITKSTVMFFALRAFLGFFKHTQLLTEAMTPDYEKDQTQLLAAYGKLSTLSAIGMSIGPIIGGHIMDKYPKTGFTMVAFIVGTVFAINAVLIKKLPQDLKREKETHKSAPKPTATVISNLKQTVAQFYKIDWHIYWEVFLFKLLLAHCTGVYLSNYALYLKSKHDISPKTLGYVTSILWAAQSFCSCFIANINKFYENDKNFTERNFHVFLTLTVSLFAMAFAPTACIYVAFVPFVAISSAVGNFATLEVILQKTDSKQRGTVLGAAGNINAISGVISPLVAGAIAHYVGSLYVIYVSIVLASLGAYKSYHVRAKKRSVQKKRQ